MKNLGKAIIGTTLLGTTGGCIALGILYNSCLDSYQSSYKDIETLKKQLEEQQVKLKEAEEQRDEAKQSLNKFADTEVDLEPCQFTETNLDYQEQHKLALERIQELEEELSTKTDSTKLYEGAVKQISELKQQIEDLQSEHKTATEHQVGMMADMSKQYEDEKSKWAIEKAEYEAKITDTVNYYLNRTSDCQWHYNSTDKRYGKVCYDNGGEVKREIWMAGDENSQVAKLLKDQFEKANDEYKFKDGQPVKKTLADLTIYQI